MTDQAPPQLPIPKIDNQTAGFWAAMDDGRLAIGRCRECRQWVHPPVSSCRRCGGPTGFESPSGRGRIHSFIVSHRPAGGAFASLVPYTVALVELDEDPGIRLPALVIDADREAVRVGEPGWLRVTGHPLDSEAVLTFESSGEPASSPPAPTAG